MLLLPDLSALANSTVGIFSDYSGEDSSSKYYTYSFLICAYGSLDPFRSEMKKVRAKCGLGDKEIAFKYFGMGAIQRALPAYLNALNDQVPGLLFTLVVEKKIVSLFGPSSNSTLRTLSQLLEQHGFGKLKPRVAEKTLRVVHTAAYLTALLGHDGQKVFWMSDKDATCANAEAHKRLLRLYQTVLGHYTMRQHPLIGGALPLEPCSTDFLDLLSASDIAAGTAGQYFTGRDDVGKQDVYVKEGADKVLMWLAYDAMALKKLCIHLCAGDNGTIKSIPFVPKQIPDMATFLPIHLCR